MACERRLYRLDDDDDDDDGHDDDGGGEDLDGQTKAAIHHLESLDSDTARLAQILQHFRDFNGANIKHADAAKRMHSIYEWAQENGLADGVNASAANDEQLRLGIKALNDLSSGTYRVSLRRSRKGTGINASNLLKRIQNYDGWAKFPSDLPPVLCSKKPEKLPGEVVLREWLKLAERHESGKAYEAVTEEVEGALKAGSARRIGPKTSELRTALQKLGTSRHESGVSPDVRLALSPEEASATLSSDESTEDSDVTTGVTVNGRTAAQAHGGCRRSRARLRRRGPFVASARTSDIRSPSLESALDSERSSASCPASDGDLSWLNQALKSLVEETKATQSTRKTPHLKDHKTLVSSFFERTLRPPRMLTSWDLSKSELDETDVLLLTEQDAIECLKQRGLPEKPILIRGTGVDAEYAEMRYDSFIQGLRLGGRDGGINVQNLHSTGPRAVQTIDRTTVVDKLSGLKDSEITSDSLPVNLLDLHGQHLDIKGPELLNCADARLLPHLLHRLRDSIKTPAMGKNRSTTDLREIDSCCSFFICGQRGTFSGLHMDMLGGTWVKCIRGQKIWTICTTLSDSEIEQFAKRGHRYVPPLDKLVDVVLRPGDIFIMPDGLRVPHAPLSLTDCLMAGGMFWTYTRIAKLIELTKFIHKYPLVTNEAIPKGLREVWTEVPALLREMRRHDDDEINTIQLAIDELFQSDRMRLSPSQR